PRGSRLSQAGADGHRRRTVRTPLQLTVLGAVDGRGCGRPGNAAGSSERLAPRISRLLDSRIHEPWEAPLYSLLVQKTLWVILYVRYSLHERAVAFRDRASLGFQGDVASVEQANDSARIVAFEGLGASQQEEEGIVLASYLIPPAAAACARGSRPGTMDR